MLGQGEKTDDNEKTRLCPEETSPESKWAFTKVRCIVVMMSTAGIFLNYLFTSNMSMAIVAMVKQEDQDTNSSSAALQNQCPVVLPLSSGPNNVYRGEFEWSPRTQGLVLGATSIGYLVTQIPGGRLAEKTNALRLISLCVGIASVLTLLIPTVARWDVMGLLVLLCCIGVMMGVTYPAISCLLTRWMPQQECSSMVATLTNGGLLSNALTPLTTAYLCTHGFAGGWPSVFYVSGMVGCTWVILMLFTVTNYPEQHPWITVKEKNYIVQNRKFDLEVQEGRMSWRKVSTSLPIWAVNIVAFTISCPQYLLQTDLPTYLNSVLKLPIDLNGILNGVTNLSSLIALSLSAAAADVIVSRGWVSLTGLRKVYIFLGGLLSSICLVAATFAGCDYITVIILMSLACAAIYQSMNASNTVALELAPSFSGTMIGIWNFTGSLPGPLVPIVVGAMTANKETFKSWNIVFYWHAAIGIVGSIFFCFFGSAEVQALESNRVGKEEDPNIQPKPGMAKPYIQDPC